MKGITLCAECAYYSTKKHKCTRGATDEGEAAARFYADCPLKDVSPVERGRWLPTNDDNKKRCSRCDVIHLIAQYPHGQANYCPNCGAKMDREQ